MARGSHARRRRLWEQNPHCHWCGRKTEFEAWADRKGKRTPAAHMATIDHVHSRLSEHRRRRRPGCYAVVLACHGCNKHRNELEMKAIPKDVKRNLDLRIATERSIKKARTFVPGRRPPTETIPSPSVAVAVSHGWENAS